MRITLQHMDGRYTTRDCDKTTEYYQKLGLHVHGIESAVYEAWNNHILADRTWQSYWLALDNQAHEERRKHETVWVVFEMRSVGQVRKGPYTRDQYQEAERVLAEVRERHDENAHFYTDAHTFPTELK